MRVLLFLVLISNLTFAHELEALKAQSVAAFMREFGETNGQFAVDLDPADCLRTGYRRSEGKVVFCQSPRVNNGGLESVDVIHHEFFHALF